MHNKNIPLQKIINYFGAKAITRVQENQDGLILNGTHQLLAEADDVNIKGKAVPLHAMKALEGRGGIAPTHSRPRR
jgi:hypothetical protein